DRRTSRPARVAAALGTAAIVMIALAGPVSAAAPGNDNIANPTVVGALPYTDGPYDTTEATTGATDPTFCFDAQDRSTVWYAFTPASSGRYEADTFGSDYDTTLYVGTSDGAGGIDVIACNDDAQDLQSGLAWAATGGTTYLLMVGTCCGDGVVGQSGGGGSLRFHVDVAPPAPSLTLTVDGTGSFNGYGVATIRGSISCGNADGVEIDADATQRVGRLLIRGFGGTFIDCTTGRWSMDISSEDGKFLGGALAVNAFAFACGPFECTDAFVSTTVRLRH
ncbi:MAG TPA: hypothetical protein VK194_11575, partial [Candidatus Deferrimicrobium sp.]|nr:hypothetical protein [Candidatus Deferrimicrobium sp.]